MTRRQPDRRRHYLLLIPLLPMLCGHDCLRGVGEELSRSLDFDSKIESFSMVIDGDGMNSQRYTATSGYLSFWGDAMHFDIKSEAGNAFSQWEFTPSPGTYPLKKAALTLYSDGATRTTMYGMSTGDSLTITVTAYDEKKKLLTGRFAGTLSKESSQAGNYTGPKISISDGQFKVETSAMSTAADGGVSDGGGK